MSYNKWVVKKVKDTDVEIIDGDRGKNYPSKKDLLEEGYTLFLSNKNLHGDKLTVNYGDFISKKRDELLRKGKLTRHDIVMSTRGSVGNIGYYNEKIPINNIRINSGMIIFRNNDNDLRNDFLYHLLKSPYCKKQYLQLTSGSVQNQLPIKDLKNLKLIIPSVQEQKEIVLIINTIESKIEVNNSIISNLEELAQTFFKHWFVDFEFPNENGDPYKSSGGKMVEGELGMMPEDWEAGILSEVAEIIMGQSPKSATYNEESIGIPLINGASDFKKDIINPLKYTTDPKRLSEKGDFLFGVRATVGNVTYVDQEYALGRGVGIARATDNKYKEFLYFQLISGIEALKNSATGSVYINFTRKDLTDMKLLIADKKTISLFHDKTNSLLNKKKLLLQQNSILTDLRDTLLPKLLSGEIELPDTMEVTDDVPVS